MRIFTRVKDIVTSNINAMLDAAEDPEKLIRQMIFDMDDTLIEIKASCAGVMANKKKVARALDEAKSLVGLWEDRAHQAVDRGREDLARVALLEKRRYQERTESLEREIAENERLIEQYQAQLTQLEERLSAAREKQRTLVQRHVQAQRKKKAQTEIRKFDTSDAFTRFDRLENRIERMEAEADLVNFGRKPSIEDQFAQLQADDEIEKELEAIKAKKTPPKPSA